jgi:hypothetical protein
MKVNMKQNAVLLVGLLSATLTAAHSQETQAAPAVPETAASSFGSFRMLASKEDYKGDKVETLLHPAGRELEPVIDDWVRANAQGRGFKQELWVRTDRYPLVYRDGSGDEVFYDMKIAATISRKLDSAGFFTQPKAFTCSWMDTTARYTLADWQADDYAKVKAVGQQFVDECIKTTQAKLGDILAP